MIVTKFFGDLKLFSFLYAVRMKSLLRESLCYNFRGVS